MTAYGNPLSEEEKQRYQRYYNTSTKQKSDNDYLLDKYAVKYYNSYLGIKHYPKQIPLAKDTYYKMMNELSATITRANNLVSQYLNAIKDKADINFWFEPIEHFPHPFPVKSIDDC